MEDLLGLNFMKVNEVNLTKIFDTFPKNGYVVVTVYL